MLQNKNVAVFIDVDNCGLSFTHYKNVLDQVCSVGNVASCKVYGVSDRRHREIIADANANGYELAFSMRVKKRNSKVFDTRIMVDVVEKVLTNKKIDAVAVVSAPTDMVYLYRFLKNRGVSIMALDNVDEDCLKLVDEVLDLGKVEMLKFPSQKPAKTVDDILEEGLSAPLSPEEKNARLQDEIARLRQENGIQLPSETDQQPQDDYATQAEEVLLEETDKQTTSTTLGGEAQSLLDEIARLRQEANVAQECASSDDRSQQPQTKQVANQDASDSVEQPQSDAEDQLISQINSIRQAQGDSDEDQFVAQIKALLDGME